MLENKGFLQAVTTDILEKCGIASGTDVSQLDPNDFSKLESRGLKSLHIKKD